MGKVEDQRAMREARYAGAAPVRQVAKAKEALAPPPAASSEKCDYRSKISGKSCTKPAGHKANHKLS